MLRVVVDLDVHVLGVPPLRRAVAPLLAVTPILIIEQVFEQRPGVVRDGFRIGY
jgi:hypothetical protein